MSEQRIKPAVIVPDTAPLVHLAAADALWLSDELRHLGGPALVVYENARVPTMLAREGVTETVAVATTRNLLELAEREGIVPDAEALWTRIMEAAPTANPASVLTYIKPTKS